MNSAGLPTRCSRAALSATAALHVAILVFISGSPSPDTRLGAKGIPLPPLVMEVTIRPPEAPAANKVPAPPTMPGLPPPTARRDAVRLLTPPPFPIEKPGADVSTLAPQAGILETAYLPTSRLSVAPRPIRPPQVHLPKDWLEAFGQSVLTLYVNAAGTVDAVKLRRTSLPPELHDVVVEAFRSVQFYPGEVDGVAVPSVMTIEADISAPIGKRR